jgi:hypothetical protein
MKLILLKCGICATWYRPMAHNGHCHYCGSLPLDTVNGRKYFHVMTGRAVEVVRGVSNPLRASILNTLITR